MAFTDRLANRGSVSTTYDIENSIRLVANDPEEMHYTTGSSSSDNQKGTFAFWIKKAQVSGSLDFAPIQINDAAAPYHAGAYFNGSDELFWDHKDNSSQWTKWKRLFRDPSAWYHVVVRIDTTQASGDNRHRLYINGGAAEDILSSHNAPVSQNDAYFWFDTGRKMTVGGMSAGHAYLADYHYIDGQSLGPDEFGETDEDSGIWKPKKYGGTFGNNGFKLEFKETGTSANSSGIGADTSGNDNHFTLINIDATNQTTDTPTNNFCTLNPLWVYGNAITTGPTNGNLKVDGGSWAGTKATMGVDKGKWYWEWKTSGSDAIVGIQTDEGVALTGNAHNIISTAAIYDEFWIKDSTSGRNDTDLTWTRDTTEVMSLALNMDDNQISIYQDGTLITNAGNMSIDGLSDKYVFPFAAVYNVAVEFNFGNPIFAIASGNADENGYGNFEHAPPDGYYALCTKNLAEFG